MFKCLLLLSLFKCQGVCVGGGGRVPPNAKIIIIIIIKNSCINALFLEDNIKPFLDTVNGLQLWKTHVIMIF